jgi:4'-phosphopantetheinyl transferase
VRAVLSRYAGRAPAELRFAVGEHGRPELLDAPVRFNLSHTRGWAVLAVSGGADVGVDVEEVRADRELIAVADRFFSPSETAELRALLAPRQPDRFFDYWTLKESYIKARGLGLSLPLDQFSFHLGDRPRISFSEKLADDPDAWQFWLSSVTLKHRFALAIRLRGPVGVTARRVVPLHDEAPFPLAGIG